MLNAQRVATSRTLCSLDVQQLEQFAHVSHDATPLDHTPPNGADGRPRLAKGQARNDEHDNSKQPCCSGEKQQPNAGGHDYPNGLRHQRLPSGRVATGA